MGTCFCNSFAKQNKTTKYFCFLAKQAPSEAWVCLTTAAKNVVPLWVTYVTNLLYNRHRQAALVVSQGLFAILLHELLKSLTIA